MSQLDTLQREALAQATQWYTRLQCETATPADHCGWQQWLQEAPVNQWAWHQLENLQQRLQGVPGGLAGRALDLASQMQQSSRRSVLKGFALLAGAGTLGWAGYRQAHDGPWLADHHSAVGQRLSVALSDGGQLLLNTDTAVDIRYDSQRRLVRLRRGEVLITTAADPAGRPFYVQTPHGLVQALGTRFSLRLQDHHSEVAVYEHQVRIAPAHGQPSRLESGQQSSFTARSVRPAQALDGTRSAWSRGLLIANDQRLDSFLEELARYRHGWLRCDPEVAPLRISGTFDLDDTDQALRALASALPVRIEARTRYWVTVAAR